MYCCTLHHYVHCSAAPVASPPLRFGRFRVLRVWGFCRPLLGVGGTTLNIVFHPNPPLGVGGTHPNLCLPLGVGAAAKLYEDEITVGTLLKTFPGKSIIVHGTQYYREGDLGLVSGYCQDAVY